MAKKDDEFEYDIDTRYQCPRLLSVKKGPYPAQRTFCNPCNGDNDDDDIAKLR